VLLGVIQVYIRDVGHLLGIGAQFLFWATPIAYLPSILPESIRPWFQLNPLAHLIGAYHSVLVYGVAPTVATVAGLVVVILLAAAMALFVYRRGAPTMADVL